MVRKQSPITVDKGLGLVEEYVDILYKTRGLNSRAQGVYQKLNQLYETSTEEVRFQIITELCAFPTKQSRLLLEKALKKDESDLVRHEAAAGLGDVGNQSTIPLLIESLKDPSWLVRHEIAMALHSIGDATALSALEQRLKDESDEVRISCKVAISAIRHRN